MDDEDDTPVPVEEAEEAEPAEAEYVFEGFEIQLNERIALTPAGKG